jgi:hypothetical protein
LLSVFPGSLLFCFSAFLLLRVLLLQSCVFIIFPIRTAIPSHIPCYLYIAGFRTRIWIVQASQISRFPIWPPIPTYGNLLMTGLILGPPITANPYLSKFEGFGGLISRFFFGL